MEIKFTPEVIKAFMEFVVTLDRHPTGGAALAALLLAAGAAFAMSKRARK